MYPHCIVVVTWHLCVHDTPGDLQQPLLTRHLYNTESHPPTALLCIWHQTYRQTGRQVDRQIERERLHIKSVWYCSVLQRDWFSEVGSGERMERERWRTRVRDGGGECLRFWFSTFLASWWKFPETFCLHTQLTRPRPFSLLVSFCYSERKSKIERVKGHEKERKMGCLFLSKHQAVPLKTITRENKLRQTGVEQYTCQALKTRGNNGLIRIQFKHRMCEWECCWSRNTSCLFQLQYLFLPVLDIISH